MRMRVRLVNGEGADHANMRLGTFFVSARE
jgi:hypothetical protein